MMLHLVVLIPCFDDKQAWSLYSSHFQVSCDPNMTFFPLHQEKPQPHKMLVRYILFLSNDLQVEKKKKPGEANPHLEGINT